MDFDKWTNSLREIIQEEGNPLILRNGHWEVEDRKKLFDILDSRIFDTHLDILKTCAVDVLSEIDPQFELPAEERYAASIHGKVLKHSPDLRQGLAETLALLGNHREMTNCSQHKPEETAVLAIREILEPADWQRWGSLNNLLPALAEAAPGEFLNAVETSLQQTPCPFDEIFAQEGHGITGRNYLTGLLWALEGLSWSEDYLVRVAVILAELASHDPGGNWGNRPANSLTTILLPWLPQTLAPIDKRITAIKAIKTEYPDIAWKVILSLLPNQHQTSSGAHKPQWRNFIPEEWKAKVTNEEYWEQVRKYAELAVEMACEDSEKLKKLVGNLDNLPKPSFDAVIDHLSTVAITELPENDRAPIWTRLTEFARKHRRYSDQEWALDNDSVSIIEATANRISPDSPEGLYRRLFVNRDFNLYEETGNWEEQRKKLEERRQKAVKEIINVRGLQGVIAFIDMVESPNKVGWALGVIADAEIDSYLLPDYLTVDNKSRRQFADSFVISRYYTQGWQWVDGINRTKWSLEQNCNFLTDLPFELETWHRVSKWLGTSENMYWKIVPVNPYHSDSDLLLAIDKLLEVSRPSAAIDCLYGRLHDKLPLDIERVVRALLDAVSTEEPITDMDTYYVTELIKALQNDPATAQEDLFKVEWAYLSLLKDYNDAEPKLLEERLATQPDFFCEVIRLIYRSTKEEQHEESDEQKNNIATNAWRLLYNWKRPPGLHSDGTFIKEEFEAWLNKVEELCEESGHFDVAMIEVGNVLFYCPADPQGLWITNAAANALNARDAEEMRRGFRTQLFNSRGAHWVDPSGTPEREMAEQWRKRADDVENAGYARFAATLRDIAESYDRDAERIIAEHKQRNTLDQGDSKVNDGDTQ